MTAFATRTEFYAWAAHRLAELDAGLAAMEAELAVSQGPPATASRLAMDTARLWRDRFAACIRLADSGAAFRDAIPGLQESWAQFEIAMENWALAAEQKNVAFDARAKALLGVWHAAAAAYKAQALTAGGGERTRIEAAIARLERDAAAYSEKFEDLKDAGKLSWVAMGQALKDSRAVFERDSDTALAALADARKH